MPSLQAIWKAVSPLWKKKHQRQELDLGPTNDTFKTRKTHENLKKRTTNWYIRFKKETFELIGTVTDLFCSDQSLRFSRKLNTVVGTYIRK